jgi:hypothetical protein
MVVCALLVILLVIMKLPSRHKVRKILTAIKTL